MAMPDPAALAVYFFVGMTVTFRLTVMFVYERGPEDIFSRLRTLIGVRFNEYSVPYGTNVVARLFLCHKCLSVWVGWGVALLLHPPGVSLMDCFWHGFAFSAATLVLQSIVRVQESR